MHPVSVESQERMVMKEQRDQLAHQDLPVRINGSELIFTTFGDKIYFFFLTPCTEPAAQSLRILVANYCQLQTYLKQPCRAQLPYCLKCRQILLWFLHRCNGETVVLFSGFQGDRGEAGPPGDVGEQGIAGEKGDVGSQGLRGDKGKAI